jgi:hypothetical protein
LDAVTTTSIVRALIGGGLIGIAVSIALVANGRIAGISGTIARAFSADGGRGFRVPFLVGLIGTGAIAAFVTPHVFGAPIRSTPMLAIAGLLVGVGTALGNGCTSGHGVCGISRFSARSIVAVVVFMGVAMITVAIAGAQS